jgi:hypothetical protein
MPQWMQPPREVVIKIERLLDEGRGDKAITNHYSLVEYDVLESQAGDVPPRNNKSFLELAPTTSQHAPPLMDSCKLVDAADHPAHRRCISAQRLQPVDAGPRDPA